MSSKMMSKKMASIVGGKGGKAPSRRSKPKRDVNYGRYIRLCLKSIDPSMTMSSSTRNTMNAIVGDVFERLAAKGGHLVRMSRRATMRPADIHAAMQLTFGTELAQMAVNKSQSALNTFQQASRKD